MIRHAWSVICQKSIIDVETNNISLDVLEELRIKTLSVPENAKGVILPVQMEIVSLWYREHKDKGSKGKGQLKIKAPNNEEVAKADIEIDLINNPRNRTRIRLDGLPIPKNVSGFFYFIVLLESNSGLNEVARIPLEVNIGPTSLN